MIQLSHQLLAVVVIGGLLHEVLITYICDPYNSSLSVRMLQPGGFTIFRESHFRPVGSRPQAINPTVYRNMKVRLCER